MVLDQPVVVLGGGGFIGANLVHRLIGLGAQVTAVDVAFPAWRHIPDDVARIADLRDPFQVLAAMDGASIVFDLAADMGGVGYFHSDADLGASLANGQITINVAQAAVELETPSVFYASSACCYPVEIQQRAGFAPKLYEDLVGHGTPDALYGAEKLHGLRIMGKVPGARVGILHTVYGPLQEHHGRRMKFPSAVVTKALRARETRLLELWGDGEQLRSYCYVDDAVDQILTIATEPVYEGPVNVGQPGAISCVDVARLVLDLAGAPDTTIVTNPSGPTGVQARDLDPAKYERLYGPMPGRGYREGFAEFLAWVDSL